MKPLLLGMNNPISDDPEYDLYPYPERSAGWRLWKMLPGEISRRQYLEMFDRRNLLRSRSWSQPAAREAAKVLLPELKGRLVVVLGSEVRAALGLPLSEPLVFRRTTSPVQYDWVPVPHPSGRNLWYNQPGNREQVGAMLLELARR
jgi:hypothetical protein